MIIPEFQIAWCPSLSHSALRSYAVVGPLGVVSLPYWNFLLFPVCCELDERSTLYLLTSGEHDSIAHNPPPRGFQILFRLRAHFPFWFFIWPTWSPREETWRDSSPLIIRHYSLFFSALSIAVNSFLMGWFLVQNRKSGRSSLFILLTCVPPAAKIPHTEERSRIIVRSSLSPSPFVPSGSHISTEVGSIKNLYRLRSRYLLYSVDHGGTLPCYDRPGSIVISYIDCGAKEALPWVASPNLWFDSIVG